LPCWIPGMAGEVTLVWVLTLVQTTSRNRPMNSIHIRVATIESSPRASQS
jgi:hypothetical protein